MTDEELLELVGRCGLLQFDESELLYAVINEFPRLLAEKAALEAEVARLRSVVNSFATHYGVPWVERRVT